MQTLDEASTERLGLVVWHLRLLQRALSRHFSSTMAEHDERYRLDMQFHSFGLLHLITTLFLLDRAKDAALGGFIFPTLSSLELERDLAALGRTFQASLGNTTFGDYIRLSRNKLATHGDLTVASLPFALPVVVRDPAWIARHDALFTRLERQVDVLTRRLEKRFAVALRQVKRGRSSRAA